MSNDTNNHYENQTDLWETSGCNGFLMDLAIFLTILVVISTLGNPLTIYIFSRQKLTPSTLLFMVLAILDFILMLLSFFIIALPNLIQTNPLYSDISMFLTAYGVPVLIINFCMSTWVVVLMAWNRYLAITRPLYYHRITKIKFVCLQLAVLFVISVIFVIPRFFEIEVLPIKPAYEGHNYYTDVTELHNNKHYQLYYRIISYLVLLNILPLSMLCFFTYKLVKEIKDSNARRQELCQGAPGQNANQFLDELRITIVLTTVVVVFIIFHTPVLVYRIMELVFYLKDPGWQCVTLDLTVYGISRVLNSFVQINATFNFVVYVISSSTFRRDLMKMCFFRMKTWASNSREDINPQAEVNAGRETSTSNISIIQLIKYSHNFGFTDDDEAPTSSQQNERASDEEQLPQQQEPQQQSQKQQQESEESEQGNSKS